MLDRGGARPVVRRKTQCGLAAVCDRRGTWCTCVWGVFFFRYRTVSRVVSRDQFSDLLRACVVLSFAHNLFGVASKFVSMRTEVIMLRVDILSCSWECA